MMGFRFLNSLSGGIGKSERERKEYKTVVPSGGEGRMVCVCGGEGFKETRKMIPDGSDKS